MGKVYLATHPAIGRQAAIKVLTRGIGDPEVVSRFMTEARVVNAIRHPNIVEIFDSGAIEGGTPYLVMEYLDGETLTQALARGPTALDEALDWTSQVAEALGAAHAHEIIHRDLKPDNLFLVADAARPGARRVKVLDFGIAKLQYPSQGQFHRTRTGTLLGTPLYMSPEQCIRPKDLDARSDVYSLGVILYEMVTGRPPFDSDSAYVVMNMHIHDPPVPPSAHRVDLPPSLEASILQALAKLPAHRQQSMVELLSQLERVRHESEIGCKSGESWSAQATTPASATPVTFGRHDVISFLTEIDDMMEGPLAIEIVGGAAALLAYGAQAPTKDINSFSDFDERIERAAPLTTHRIPLRRAIPSYDLGHYDDRRLRLYLPFRNLVVWVPDRYDLLFMKSARASGRDLQVLQEMHTLKPFDLGIIIERFNESPALDRFAPQLQLVISRLFGEQSKRLRRVGRFTNFQGAR